MAKEDTTQEGGTNPEGSTASEGHGINTIADLDKTTAAESTTEPQGPDYETVAKEKGWKPLEEFDGPKETWVGAEEFVKREPLFDKIRSQSKELKEVRKTLDAMSSSFNKTVEAQVNLRLKELKEERVDAIKDGDVERVEELDKEIATTQQAAPKQQPQQPEMPPEIKSFVEANPWFETNEEARTFAIAHNKAYLTKNPGKLADSLLKTREAVEKAYPELFGKKNDPPPPPPNPSVEEGGHRQTTGSKGYTTNRLTEEQRLVYNQLVVQNNQMTHEEYFKGLESIGELS